MSGRGIKGSLGSTSLDVRDVGVLYQPVHGLLAPDTGADSIEGLIALEPRAHRGRGQPGTLRESGYLFFDILVGGLQVFAPSHLVDCDRSFDRVSCRPALAFPKLGPVD